MHYKSPDNETLKPLGQSLNWDIAAQARTTVREYLDPFSARYEWLEGHEKDTLTADFSERTYTSPTNNPYNAWYVTTDIPSNRSDVLSFNRISIGRRQNCLN